MNCPYCDETVHLASKFCPRCGLPLKDETTVMGSGGAYLSDEAGPARWVVLTLAGAIVVVALSVGWLNSRKPAEVTQTRREPVAVNPAFGRPINPVGFSPINPAFGFSGLGRPAAPSANYSPQVRWAYTPPPTPVVPRRPAVRYVAPEPTPPPILIAANPVLTVPFTPPRVAPSAEITPAVPVADTVPPPVNLPAGVVLPAPDPATAYLNAPFGSPVVVPPAEEVNGTWVYDPVQERYVLNPERIRRVPRGTGRRAPAAGTSGPVNPATGRPIAPAEPLEPTAN